MEALQLADPEKASRVQAEILALRDQANQLLESRYTRIVDAIDGAINPVLQSALGFALLFMCYVVGEMLLLLTSLLFRSKAFRSESATRLARIAASDNQMVQMSAEKSQAAIELAYAVLALTLLLSVWLLHRSDNLLSAPLALLPVLGALLFSCWFVKSMASEIDQELEAFETLAKAPQ
ncbi:MAG TPA: hypothetical protein DCS45_06335 [Roseovarius nubinhibens]|uniref:Uncharacterized protein n=1 Tax=Roseovarius nubinhibens TaxID=314263 RepID=A0A348WAC1_9RHOB|nr:hypothetical protein [Roseovarius nubinhibens]